MRKLDEHAIKLHKFVPEAVYEISNYALNAISVFDESKRLRSPLCRQLKLNHVIDYLTAYYFVRF